MERCESISLGKETWMEDLHRETDIERLGERKEKVLKVLQDHLDIFECHILHHSHIHLSISPDDNPTHNQVPQTKQSPNPIHEFVDNQDSPNGKKNQVLDQSGKPPLPPKSSPLTTEKFSKKQQDRPVITKVVARRIDNGSSLPSYSLDELLAPQGSSSVKVGSRRNRDQEVQNRVSSSSDSVINIPDSPAKKKTKTNPRRMVVMVQPYGESSRSLVEVNAKDNVEELRKELVKMQERVSIDLETPLSIDTMKKVIIENQSGSSFTIDVAFWDTVLTIKQKIEMTQGTPVFKQTLIFKRKVLLNHLNIVDCQILHNSRLHLYISPDDNPTQNQVPQSPSNPIHEFVNNQDSPEGKKNQVLHQSGKPPLPSKSSPLTTEKFGKNQHDRHVITKVMARRIDNGSSRPSYSLDELLAPQGSSSVTVGSIRNRDQEVQNRVSSASDSDEEAINIPNSPVRKKTKITKVVARRIHNEYSSGPAYSLDELLAPQRSSTVAVGSIRNRNQKVENRVSSPSDSVEEVINIPDSPAKKKTKTNPRKMVVIVQPYGQSRRILVGVNADDNVEEMRKELVKMQERGVLNLPHERYNFIHEQAVLNEDQSFLTNGVASGDTIEIFSAYVTYRGSYTYKATSGRTFDH
ncbi:Ubiquitin-like domain superfamily [Arabidopsis suecica]|uniref:Ubiquitin-like domain superfamily n=1 Tax=Arabidopsis suecica TaxID=45249 RepID=A0A8T1ZI03_ARASU|nr:Ubiquitin-like domain superfamily [Arabidopsis suecica]